MSKTNDPVSDGAPTTRRSFLEKTGAGAAALAAYPMSHEGGDEGFFSGLFSSAVDLTVMHDGEVVSHSLEELNIEGTAVQEVTDVNAYDGRIRVTLAGGGDGGAFVDTDGDGVAELQDDHVDMQNGDILNARNAGEPGNPMGTAYVTSISGDGDTVDIGPGIKHVAEHLVTTTSELESAFSNAAAGDTIWLGTPSTPYRPSQWLDIDVDGLSVVGQSMHADDGQPLIKVADGANVGGIRVGHNAHCENVTIQNIGYHGNDLNQDSTIKRLHGIIVRDAANVELKHNYLTRTSPYHEHNTGGSGISVESAASAVEVTGNRIHDIGDRGIQTAAQDVRITDNIATAGFDRSISTNLEEPDGVTYAASNVTIANNIGSGNAEGSIIGTDGEDITITGNIGRGQHRSFITIIDASKNVTVVGNEGTQDSTDATRNGIKVSSSNRGVTIAGNTLRGYSGAGIAANSAGITVSGNLVVSPSSHGIVAGGRGVGVTGNSIYDAGGNGILVNIGDSEVTGNVIDTVQQHGISIQANDPALVSSNMMRGANQATGYNDIECNASGNVITGNKVRPNGATTFNEASGSNNNLWANNFAVQSVATWGLVGADSMAYGNAPAFDVHRGLSDGDSNNSVSVTFAKPYTARPILQFGRRGGGITGISYTTDANGNYDGATVSISSAGGTIDVFVDAAT